jgi:hypothetical protein
MDFSVSGIDRPRLTLGSSGLIVGLIGVELLASCWGSGRSILVGVSWLEIVLVGVP